MLLTVLGSLAVTVPALASPAASKLVARSNSSSSYPVVNTIYGPVQGNASEYRDGVTVYKGIPFAAPPTGEKRWRAPSAPESWTDVLEATTWPNQCAQTGLTDAVFTTTRGNASEDCLYLNVWTPTYNATTLADITSLNLPVYVWIFGGRFSVGSANVQTYDGSGFAVQDIIVVDINYRLSSFGFLAHPDLSTESGHNSSGNYGILDQQFALQWVKDNIAQFGGNPNQVTVGGQSAGSASALDMMWSPLSEGLVQGVIAESGALGPHDPYTGAAATSYREKEAAEAYGVSFLETLNVSSIAELRTNVSMDTLLEYAMTDDTTFDDTQFANMTSFFMDPPEWRPVIDGYVLLHSYGDALLLGAHADIPILTGNNKDESGASPDEGFNVSTYTTDWNQVFGSEFYDAFIAAYPAGNTTQANHNANEFFRDMSRVGTWQWANDWAAGGAQSNVYTYYWTHTPPVTSSEGAYHGSELWYVFNNIPYSADYETVNWTSTDVAIEANITKYWANFIRTGNPNGDGLTYFPPSTNATKQTMWLGDSWGAGEISASEERFEFINSWYPTLKEW